MTAGREIEPGWKASTVTIAPTLLFLCHREDTLDEDDVLMSWKYKTHICKSRSREHEFSSKFRFTPALVDKDNYSCGP